MLKRIAVKDVKLGMFICEFCGSWMEHPFWKTKFLLDDPRDLHNIQSSGIKELWIDVGLGLDVDTPGQGKSREEVEQEAENLLLQAGKSQLPERVAFDEEIKIAAKLCAKTKTAVMEMFNDARMGKAIEVEQAQAMVEEISQSVMRHPHALISLARLKNADEYTYMHSVAVCALMIALARQLKLEEPLVQEAGLAGLLHDLGKMGIPAKILNKPGKLTLGEFTIIKSHPQIGADILLNNPLVSPLVLDVILHHHEKVDGTGYPHQLKGDNITLFAKMGAVCDVYDAITSNRPYKKGWAPAESIRKMAEWSKGHFDERVFQAFVKTVGIYPTGSLVRLESDRLGVVVEQNEKSLLQPKVKIFFSAKTRSPIVQETIDLSRLAGKDKITGRESPDDWGFKNLDNLWLDY
ncbi:HD-GYP domain-containing protein [Cellvibrio japonicus]|uniref:HD domain protein n=1 Tax=Cellvibrio japonicus (strain Ueda107) TaxID=498211 RepID=B3PF42_CELJU|nr:HD-GYP domain-containing protein [Cellvibrio japonicus]ACE82890.1 HD domain protein [Cellvibrio japonicus Ueda107]QEI13599.1 HD-GYP domain-containing protein [Cellvibrio japonicus]QEI17173.1 HD-GYP domain-containing protein [Cellvibrio japonicus]QEI20750.1 HD-GYP domain-containing protein [Cellvibrio japonicus]